MVNAFSRNIRRADWAAPHRLQRWARRRQSDNTVSAYAFEGINRLFSNADPLAVLARGPLLGLAGRLPPLVEADAVMFIG